MTFCIFDTTVLSPDELDGQEERQLQYLDQEKLSYITNYLEQTRDTDVHSVSTEDDSGKPGSNSAPSEFGFEETTGKTQSISRVPNPSPPEHLSTCSFPGQDDGHFSLRVCSCYIGISSWFIQAGKGAGAEKKQSSFK